MNISMFQKCANCGACSNICPAEAITIDKTGVFYKPMVDERKCTHCGLCASRCPVNVDTEAYKPMYACAGWHKYEHIVMDSSSGGAFYGLAQYVIAHGGAVFGAVYTEKCREVCFVSSDEADLSKFRKSKYVESLIDKVFIQIKEILAQGRAVLFCGTPCQVAGLYAFLGERTKGLLTCDFACGGLPSHKIYQDYLQGLEKKYGALISAIDFRPKTHGWRRYAVLAKFENGRVYNRLGAEDPYLKSYLYGKYTVRDYCLDCKFSDHHVSDITVADFWLNTRLSGPENPKGVSLILCNTHSGIQAVKAISEQYMFRELSLPEVAYNHKKTESTSQDRAKHDMFVRFFVENGLESAYRKYLPTSVKDSWKNWLRRLMCKSRVHKK